MRYFGVISPGWIITSSANIKRNYEIILEMASSGLAQNDTEPSGT